MLNDQHKSKFIQLMSYPGYDLMFALAEDGSVWSINPFKAVEGWQLFSSYTPKQEGNNA